MEGIRKTKPAILELAVLCPWAHQSRSILLNQHDMRIDISLSAGALGKLNQVKSAMKRNIL
jgi:protein subunit release factor A